MKTIWMLPILLGVIVSCTQNLPPEQQQMVQTEMIRIEGDSVDAFGNGNITTIAPFHLDKYLVTYEQYGQFIKTGGYKKKEFWSDEGRKFLETYEFWVPSTYHEASLNKNRLPVTGVSWYEAQAYAKWRGARLPTAAEWALSCRGAGPLRRYPWGDAFDPEAIGYRVRLAPYAVGSVEKNVSPSGVFDLVGNVWQWCADAYEGPDFRLDAEPTGTKPGPNYILRGGGWMSL